ncbi:MAG: DUF1232 domain-containing protein [Gemmatimonadaceae bacterium]|nr:DUF1232 domain-containing protein [Gemmatimonadaceae bacterium]NUQ92581.1 DUF1232 domain-containing protein [Gemmatimonadaceae bacterium]NUR18605.1 DUF1232 domain-containing protein [Gemmatimonadaceae bacterium]
MSPRVEGGTAHRRRGKTRRDAAEIAAAAPVEFEEGEVAGPRNGARRTVMHYIRQLPNYLRLLMGLMTDARVSAVDKLLVAGAIAYIIMPIDLVPDFIPFLGEVDDVYLLVLALQRLIGNAGRSVLLAHWSGAAEDLADMNLRAVFSAAAFFLPAKIRRRLRGATRR